MNSILNHKIYATPLAVNFQPSHSPIMDGIVSLHHDIMIYMLLIMVSIIYVLLRTSSFSTDTINVVESYRFNRFSYSISGVDNYYFDIEMYVEIIWAIIPAAILALICISTISFLYSTSSYLYVPVHTIYVTGHQWYWSYEYSELGTQFDSYMVLENYLKFGELRLLEVDNRLIIPAQSHLRVFVTSDDVIHSWAVPSLGIKLDASPGRINHCHLFASSIGIFYGQCSELCGIGHNYMPIVVQAIPIYVFNYITKLLPL